MNPQEATLILMNELLKPDVRFELILPCEIEECREIAGRRFTTPMGIRCERCLGRVLAAALENGGRLWTCHCNSNAAPCQHYMRSGRRIDVCANSPCYHKPSCHLEPVRKGQLVTIWFGSQKAAA